MPPSGNIPGTEDHDDGHFSYSYGESLYDDAACIYAGGKAVVLVAFVFTGRFPGHENYVRRTRGPARADEEAADT